MKVTRHSADTAKNSPYSRATIRTLGGVPMRRTVTTLTIAVLALAGATFAASATSADRPATLPNHVQVAEGDEFLPGTALRKDFRPLPGQNSLPEQTYLNAVRQSPIASLAHRNEAELLAANVAACDLIDAGFTPDALAGFMHRQHGWTLAEADVIAVASIGTCAGSVLAGSLDPGTAA